MKFVPFLAAGFFLAVSALSDEKSEKVEEVMTKKLVLIFSKPVRIRISSKRTPKIPSKNELEECEVKEATLEASPESESEIVEATVQVAQKQTTRRYAQSLEKNHTSWKPWVISILSLLFTIIIGYLFYMYLPVNWGTLGTVVGCKITSVGKKVAEIASNGASAVSKLVSSYYAFFVPSTNNVNLPGA